MPKIAGIKRAGRGAEIFELLKIFAHVSLLRLEFRKAHEHVFNFSLDVILWSIYREPDFV